MLIRVFALGFVALFPFAAHGGAWEPVAPMKVTREYPGLAVLPDGRILAVTGHPLNGESLASAEIYDPETNTWSATGSLNVPRNGVEPSGLVTLANQNVLITGGGSGNRSVHETELFNPESEEWTLTGPMNVPRCVLTTTQLVDGRVLVTGGIDWLTEVVHNSSELYDPNTGTWTETGSMSESRFVHCAVRLEDGRVLVMGGVSAYPSEDNVLASAEIYDPKTGAWRGTSAMKSARRSHRAVLLNDGRVLVCAGAAGYMETEKAIASCEVFDPTSEEWTEIAPLREARWGPSATLLPDGTVLVAGGAIGRIGARSSAELFDPATNTWRDAGNLKQARNGHRAIAMRDGRILIAGGWFVNKYLDSCEIYAPQLVGVWR